MIRFVNSSFNNFPDVKNNFAPCVKGYNGGYGGGNGQGCSGGGSGTGGVESLSCGIAKQGSRIVGGTQADIKEFPWQVGFKSWSGARKPFCGGSLIDKKWVLSAAHCFEYSGSYPQLRVVLGEFDTENEEGNEVLMKVRKVSTKILALGVRAYLRLFSEKGGFPGGMFVRKRVVFMLRRAQSCGKRRQPLRPGISLGGKGRWGAPPSPVIIIMILWYTYLDMPRSLCTRTQGYEIGNNACMWLTLSSVELWGRRYMGSTTTYIWLECGKDRGQTTSSSR